MYFFLFLQIFIYIYIYTRSLMLPVPCFKVLAFSVQRCRRSPRRYDDTPKRPSAAKCHQFLGSWCAFVAFLEKLTY